MHRVRRTAARRCTPISRAYLPICGLFVGISMWSPCSGCVCCSDSPAWMDSCAVPERGSRILYAKPRPPILFASFCAVARQFAYRKKVRWIPVGKEGFCLVRLAFETLWIRGLNSKSSKVWRWFLKLAIRLLFILRDTGLQFCSKFIWFWSLEIPKRLDSCEFM